MNIGIIGAGLIGGKRARAIRAEDKILKVADISLDRAKALATEVRASFTASPEEIITDPNIEAVIVSTTNQAIPDWAVKALRAGKNVLVEKPAGRNPADIESIIRAKKESAGVLAVGFNHRFHPAFLKLKKLLTENALGELMYFRARYGHGGRLGYDKEWRAVPEIGGGGELLDQGVHLIDLCRWLGGEFQLEWGRTETFFWNMPVEDNGFLMLKSPDSKQRAFLHASCTEWKNLFDFEVFGKKGKLQVFGIGRSYGKEELRFYKMKPEMGPPDIEIETFPEEDLSWHREWEAFCNEVKGAATHIAKIEDASKAIEIVHAAYRMSQ